MLKMRMDSKKGRKAAVNFHCELSPLGILNLILTICSYFAGEIIGNVLDIEARRWRRPKRVDFRMNKSRTVEFMKKYSKFDWTSQ